MIGFASRWLMVFGLLGGCLASPALAQLDNRPLYTLFPLDSARTHQLDLRVNLLGFNKNNEFSNALDPGRTYFGYHFWPSLAYQPDERMGLQLGLLLWQDFGRDDPVLVVPTFTFKYHWKGFDLIFGNLEGTLAHQMPEPVFDFERLMTRRLETGLQVKYGSEQFSADIFVDWQRMIYESDLLQEDIFFGGRLGWWAARKEHFQMELTFQSTVQHLGGQINHPSVDDPILTLYNLVPGFRADWLTGGGFIHQVFAEVHYLQYLNGQPVVPWQSGWGFYPTLGLRSELGNVMVSYWLADQYYTPYGGPMFSGVTRFEPNAGYTEDRRQLLFLRLTNNLHIGERFQLVSRFTPLYNFQENQAEYYFGLYLPLDMRFSLAKSLNFR